MIGQMFAGKGNGPAATQAVVPSGDSDAIGFRIP